MTDKLFKWSWMVPEDFAALRVDKAVFDALEGKLSRSRIQKLIEDGELLVNSNRVGANLKLQAGDQVELSYLPPKPLEQVEPENIPLEILWQDEHLVVINKPQGLTVHPAATQPDNTLVNALLFHIKDLSGIGGVLRPGIVHRLDKNTSGVMVVTKTDEAHQKLAKVFAAHDIDRRYWALVYGTLDPRDVTLETKIGRHSKDRKKMSTQVEMGRSAITDFKTLEEYATVNRKPFASWIEAKLLTGRTHQVRVHLDSLHHSVLGDPVYGSPTTIQDPKWRALPKEVQKRVAELPGQALHARKLAFIHPVSNEALSFESDPPKPFQAVLEELKKFRN